MLYNTQHLVVNRYASHATRNNWLIPQLCVLDINCSMGFGFHRYWYTFGDYEFVICAGTRARGLAKIYILTQLAHNQETRYSCGEPRQHKIFWFFSSFLGVMLIKSQTLSRIARLPNLYCIYSI